MSGEEVFMKRYEALNAGQKAAVDRIEGPVMVIAGPGTGKTSVLVMRIASILKHTDTEPRNILALTFTEAGVLAVRKALADVIGSDAHQVKIHTFHSFCNSLITELPEEFPRIIGGSHIPESEQIDVIEQILKESDLTHLTPFGDPFFYVRDLIRSIQTLKRDGITPKAFTEAVEEDERVLYEHDDLYHESGKSEGLMKGKYQRELKYIEKNKEFIKIFKAYEDALRERNRYDYDDMIIEVVNALESNKELSLMIQEDNHYILADEHQDANNAQNRVIQELTSFHSDPNVFIVGDEKQAIYRFQGASRANFMYFKDLYPDIEQVYLTDNYRSQQTILDAAHSLIEKSPFYDPSFHTSLTACSERKEQPLIVRTSRTVSDEAVDVASRIDELLNEGEDPEEVAVLVRDHKDADIFAKAFEKKGISFVRRSDKDLFEDPYIQNIISLLRAVCDPTNEEAVVQTLLMDISGLDTVDVVTVSRAAALQRTPLAVLLKDRKALSRMELNDPDALIERYASIKYWATIANSSDLMTALETVLRRSGALDRALIDEQSVRMVSKIKAFFKEAERFAEASRRSRIPDFLAHLDTIDSYGISLKVSDESMGGSVELLTAHSSKGREFDHVFIGNAVNGKWGGRRQVERIRFPEMYAGLQHSNDDEDERRLFYVALTRARKSVHISSSHYRDDGKEQLPSPFIDDIDPAFLLKEETDATADIDLLFSPTRTRGPSLEERRYIQGIFLEQPLSVTAVNTYLTCPWQYFYMNLMRIPGTYTRSQRFGTAVHEALSVFFSRYADEKRDPGKEFLLDAYRTALRRLPLLEEDENILTHKGLDALGGYYDAYSGTWRTDIVTEKAITDVTLDCGRALPHSIALTGKLDKIEGENERVVVDYKTGKPKSRNMIEGSTKNSDGGIKRQLVFYKLLVDSSSLISGSMESGEIDFVEPNERGKYKKESFTITNDDVDGLIETIKEMAYDIYELKFWDRRCDLKNCPYCSLRERVFTPVTE